jgi:S-adenosylmethionine:tRNA ribosyltransferase-isomerase
MKSELFDFALNPERIAQKPVEPRDSSKLLLCQAQGRLGEWQSGFEFSHKTFRDIEEVLGPNDLLITNNAKVLPIRMLGHRAEGGGAVEALLLKRLTEKEWSGLMHLSAKIKPGLKVIFEPGVVAEVLSTHEERVANEGAVRLAFSGLALEKKSLEEWLEKHGHVPLPPYIERTDLPADKKTYQTVYAQKTGSAAAPTAGFHFTDELLAKLDAKGVKRTSVTLNVGIGTFRPIKADEIEDHPMHEESFEISESFLKEFNSARAAGKRIVAVGTTVIRTLESWSAICEGKGIELGSPDSLGTYSTRAYIKPGYRFRIVDDLITNFHLPRSTLLVLVAAAMGLDPMKQAYAQAIENEYRFFSYGDSMFIRGLIK